jgi:hypothetical protein
LASILSSGKSNSSSSGAPSSLMRKRCSSKCRQRQKCKKRSHW